MRYSILLGLDLISHTHRWISSHTWCHSHWISWSRSSILVLSVLILSILITIATCNTIRLSIIGNRILLHNLIILGIDLFFFLLRVFFNSKSSLTLPVFIDASNQAEETCSTHDVANNWRGGIFFLID